MRFSSIVAAASTVATVLSKDVACVIDGEAVSTVDLDSGSCDFTIPSSLPVSFKYTAADDYSTDFYYLVAQNFRYFNDIVNAGRSINVPAKSLYGSSGSPLYQVHAEKSPAANNTLKRNINAYKRDAASDLADSLKAQDGSPVESHKFEVLDISTAPATSTETVTHHTSVTITSCEDDKCTETVVPGKETVTTVTVNDEVTSYTTVCPLTETDVHHTTVTITSCDDHKCVVTPVPGKETVTTVTKNGEVTSYTTVCPLTEGHDETTSTVLVTVTSCVDNKCHPTVVPGVETMTTVTVNGEVTSYTTVCPLTESTEAEESTVYTTVTTCEGDNCAATVVPDTAAPGAAPTDSPAGSAPAESPAGSAPVESAPAGAAPGGSAPAGAAPTTVAGESTPETTAPAAAEDTTFTLFATVVASSVAANPGASGAASVSTYAAGAAGISKSFFVLVLVPLVGLF